MPTSYCWRQQVGHQDLVFNGCDVCQTFSRVIHIRGCFSLIPKPPFQDPIPISPFQDPYFKILIWFDFDLITSSMELGCLRISYNSILPHRSLNLYWFCHFTIFFLQDNSSIQGGRSPLHYPVPAQPSLTTDQSHLPEKRKYDAHYCITPTHH